MQESFPPLDSNEVTMQQSMKNDIGLLIASQLKVRGYGEVPEGSIPIEIEEEKLTAEEVNLSFALINYGKVMEVRISHPKKKIPSLKDFEREYELKVRRAAARQQKDVARVVSRIARISRSEMSIA